MYSSCLTTLNFVTIAKDNRWLQREQAIMEALDNAGQSAYDESERDFLPLIQTP